MKNRRTRLGECGIPTLTDALVTRLPEPYNLIAAWSKFLPLEVVLSITCEEFATGLFRRNRQRQWLDLVDDQLPVYVPTHLFEKTLAYVVNKRPIEISPLSALFVTTDGEAMDIHEYCNMLKQVISQS